MQLDLLPLLRIERELHDIPRGMARFRAYLATITGGTDDVVLPIGSMNPMGKDHVVALLDDLIGFDAEAVAAEAMAIAGQRLAALPGQLHVGLVVTDDLLGGWTNRYFCEMQYRFGDTKLRKRPFAVANLWTSESWTAGKVLTEVLSTIYRAACHLVFGQASTLQEMLLQEGRAAVFAGIQAPELEADEVDYSREVIRPHLDSTHYPTQFAALFGDEAASTAGYAPLGLSPRAGYAVAIADALEETTPPENVLLAMEIRDERDLALGRAIS